MIIICVTHFGYSVIFSISCCWLSSSDSFCVNAPFLVSVDIRERLPQDEKSDKIIENPYLLTIWEITTIGDLSVKQRISRLSRTILACASYFKFSIKNKNFTAAVSSSPSQTPHLCFPCRRNKQKRFTWPTSLYWPSFVLCFLYQREGNRYMVWSMLS